MLHGGGGEGKVIRIRDAYIFKEWINKGIYFREEEKSKRGTVDQKEGSGFPSW